MCAMCGGAARAAQRCIALGYFMPVRAQAARRQPTVPEGNGGGAAAYNRDSRKVNSQS